MWSKVITAFSLTIFAAVSNKPIYLSSFSSILDSSNSSFFFVDDILHGSVNWLYTYIENTSIFNVVFYSLDWGSFLTGDTFDCCPEILEAISCFDLIS